MMDYAMPYMIGQLKLMTDKIAELEASKKVEPPKEEQAVDNDGFGNFQEGDQNQDADEWNADGNW